MDMWPMRNRNLPTIEELRRLQELRDERPEGMAAWELQNYARPGIHRLRDERLDGMSVSVWEIQNNTLPVAEELHRLRGERLEGMTAWEGCIYGRPVGEEQLRAERVLDMLREERAGPMAAQERVRNYSGLRRLQADENVACEAELRWQFALFAEVVGPTITREQLSAALFRIWHLRDPQLSVSSVDRHLFRLRFENKTDMERAEEQTPVAVDGGRLLIMQRAWTGIPPLGYHIRTGPLWVYLQDLPMGCYSETRLARIVAPLGQFLRLDDVENAPPPLQYAKVLVEVEFQQVLPHGNFVPLQGGQHHFVPFHYEHNRRLCRLCALFGFQFPFGFNFPSCVPVIVVALPATSISGLSPPGSPESS